MIAHWLGRAFHKHKYIIRWTQEEIWVECNCGEQLDIADEDLDIAYEKIRNKDLDWDVDW